MFHIAIPPPNYIHKNGNTDECGCHFNIFKYRIIGSDKFISQRSENSFVIFNDKVITILPFSTQTVKFSYMIITSLPAVCILTCHPYLHLRNLAYNITLLRTNDNYLHIALTNLTSNTITLNPCTLQVKCHIVIPGQPFVVTC
jgi:hypothetical protein